MQQICITKYLPLQLVIHISDLDENILGIIRKFADDTKIAKVVANENGYHDHSLAYLPASA